MPVRLSYRLRHLLTRLLRVQRHVLYGASCAGAEEPQWLADEQVRYLLNGSDLTPEVQGELRRLSPDIDEYLGAIRHDSAKALIVFVRGQLVHYAFVLTRTKTLCLFGQDKSVALIGNAYTVPSYRGHGCQARSAAARIALAARLGFRSIVSETSPDNVSSQKGLVKGGLEEIGPIGLLIVLNTLVVRYRRPNAAFPRLGLCLR